VVRRKSSVAAVLAVFAVLWFILWRQLANEWAVNEQYSYGWFVPFFAAYLFWLRWDDRPEPCARDRAHTRLPFLLLTSALLLFLLLPIRLFEVGNPDWRPLGWIHAAAAVALTLCLLWRAGGWQWVKHFAFPVAFILVAVPWVTPIEGPIVQGLMRIVAAISTETLALFGVPAQLEGSVIRISSGVVGVNEACSGVRSLQTSLMIGLLFGELKRLSIPRRLALVGGAAAIAFIANCARAFFLVRVAAHDGVAAVDKWHDIAGYAILGAVFLGTMGVAALLHGSPVGNQESDVTGDENPQPKPAFDARPTTFPFLLPTSYFLLCLAWLVAVEVAVEAWYRVHERDLVATQTWNVRWPESAAEFRDIPIDDEVKAILRFDEGRQVSWRNAPPASEGMQTVAQRWSMFFFRWGAGTTSILRARAHRPDICLPNIGWRVSNDHGVRRYAMADGFELPFRHFTFVREAQSERAVSAHAFFCQRENRVQAGAPAADATAGGIGGWARSDRLHVVMHGLRNQGQQVLQFVLLTPRTVTPQAIETEFAELVPRIVTVGD
jgi:exosortase